MYIPNYGSTENFQNIWGKNYNFSTYNKYMELTYIKYNCKNMNIKFKNKLRPEIFYFGYFRTQIMCYI